VGVGDAGSPERPDDVERHASDCCVSGCVGLAAVDEVEQLSMPPWWRPAGLSGAIPLKVGGMAEIFPYSQA
jgi:hypothetical protein